MKELSTEEKARAYDEALKRAKSKIKNDKDHVLYEDDVIEIFPELAESEGEKIIKAIAQGIGYLVEDFGWSDFGGIPIDDILVWIKKQGEQVPEVEYVYPKFRVGNLIEEIEPNGYSKPVRVKYIGCGYYSCESDDHKRFLSLPIKQEDDFRLVEEKDDSELDEASYRVALKRIIDNPKSYGLVKIDKDVQEWIESIIKDYEELAQADKDHLETIKAKINILKSIILSTTPP